MPGIPLDTLMNFYMLCSTLGEDVAQGPQQIVSWAIGVRALEMLRELAALLAAEFYDFNPIRTYEALAGRDDYAYCPFAYGYSNYARPGDRGIC